MVDRVPLVETWKTLPLDELPPTYVSPKRELPTRSGWPSGIAPSVVEPVKECKITKFVWADALRLVKTATTTNATRSRFFIMRLCLNARCPGLTTNWTVG